MAQFKSPSQPFCVCCTKPIRKHTVTHWLRTDPAHVGHSSDFIKHVYVPELPRSKEEAQRLTNGKIVAVRRGRDAGTISQFNTWDGESYVDQFFCTGTCARDFGYICARGGKVTKRYNEFLEARAKKESK